MTLYEEANLEVFPISVHLKSGLIIGVIFGGSGLLRKEHLQFKMLLIFNIEFIIFQGKEFTDELVKELIDKG